MKTIARATNDREFLQRLHDCLDDLCLETGSDFDAATDEADMLKAELKTRMDAIDLAQVNACRVEDDHD